MNASIAVHLIFLFLWALFAPAPAEAHNPGISRVEVALGEDAVAADMTFSRREFESLVAIDRDHNGAVTAAEWVTARQRIDALAPRLFEIRVDGMLVSGTGRVMRLDDSDALHIALDYPAIVAPALQLRSPLLAQLAPGHRQHLVVNTTQQEAATHYLLDARHPEVVVPRLGSAGTQWWRFVREGAVHIWLGFDHLLFLVSLLLPSVLSYSRLAWRSIDRLLPALREMIKVITAFSVAHSITLGLAVTGLAVLPSRLVESLIAASVVTVALNNVYPALALHRWSVAFWFGLVHGLGLAGVLNEIEISRQMLLPLLLSFNIGVEIGQCVIVLLFFPLAFCIRRTAFYSHCLMRYGSMAIALTGFLWLGQRVWLVS